MTAHVFQDTREIEPLCSFCQRRKSEVKILISNGSNPARYICGGCVVLFKKATSDHDHSVGAPPERAPD